MAEAAAAQRFEKESVEFWSCVAKAMRLRRQLREVLPPDRDSLVFGFIGDAALALAGLFTKRAVKGSTEEHNPRQHPAQPQSSELQQPLLDASDMGACEQQHPARTNQRSIDA